MNAVRRVVPQRYVALLRAINVGGRTVKMHDLRALFEALKFKNVSTFIASGNVLFETTSTDVPALERRIEKHLEKSLGFSVDTFVRTMDEMRAIAEHQPFTDTATAHAVYVGFVKDPMPAEARTRLMALADANNAFHITGRELHWLSRVPTTDTKMTGPVYDKTLKAPITFRNVTSVRKLAAK